MTVMTTCHPRGGVVLFLAMSFCCPVVRVAIRFCLFHSLIMENEPSPKNYNLQDTRFTEGSSHLPPLQLRRYLVAVKLWRYLITYKFIPHENLTFFCWGSNGVVRRPNAIDACFYQEILLDTATFQVLFYRPLSTKTITSNIRLSTLSSYFAIAMCIPRVYFLLWL